MLEESSYIASAFVSVMFVTIIMPSSHAAPH